MRSFDLPETLNIGRGTREIIVGTKSCPPLTLYGIALTGVSHADEEFCFVRHSPQMTQLLVSLGGEGEVMVDGEWRLCLPGNAYLTPPMAPHAYRSSPSASAGAISLRTSPPERGQVEPQEARANWVVCWVMYANERHPGPGLGGDEPSLFPVDGQALRNAIENLNAEAMGSAEPAVLQSWASLVHSYAQRVISPPSRLAGIWKSVGADLAHPWTLTDLAGIVEVTPEQVRRICKRELGCSPMHHVAELRMRAAASLLASEFYTIEAVAERVGYDNAFAFSTAFKRRMGITPSDFRRHSPVAE